MSKKGLLALDDFERAMTKEIPLRMTVKAGKVMDEKKKQAAFLARQVVLGLRMQWDSEQLIGHPGDPKKGRFWHNRTYKAVTHMFFMDYNLPNSVGFYGYYSINLEYAKPLEVRFGALTTMIDEYSKFFLDEVQKLYGG